MKILSSLTSPYGRKARIVLLEKKIDCQLDVDIPWDEDSPVPEYNPLGKVPVLVLDDGTALYDSRVIVEYLDNLSPVSRLLPAGRCRTGPVSGRAIETRLPPAGQRGRSRPRQSSLPRWLSAPDSSRAVMSTIGIIRS